MDHHICSAFQRFCYGCNKQRIVYDWTSAVLLSPGSSFITGLPVHTNRWFDEQISATCVIFV
jgi:hypothetical protein